MTGHLRVLVLDLNRDGGDETVWRSVLGAEERERADRFRRAGDRRSFIAAHALARLALAEETGIRADALQFAPTPKGKPVLSPPLSGHEFSLSHTDGHVAVAVADRPVGVDVENIRRPRIDFALAETAFGAATARTLGPDPGAESWRRAFFSAWTVCEAVLKAEGVGLAVPMERIALGDGQAVLDGRRWTVWRRDLPPDHCLAVAWEREASPDFVPLTPADLTRWSRAAPSSDRVQSMDAPPRLRLE